MTGMIPKQEYKVWFDKTFPCPTSATGAPGGVLIIKKRFKPYLKVIYKNDLGTEIEQGLVTLQVIPKATLSVRLSYSATIFYKDV